MTARRICAVCHREIAMTQYQRADGSVTGQMAFHKSGGVRCPGSKSMITLVDPPAECSCDACRARRAA